MLYLKFQVKIYGTVLNFHLRLKRFLLQCSGTKLLRWLIPLHNHHEIEKLLVKTNFCLECCGFVDVLATNTLLTTKINTQCLIQVFAQ